MASNKSKNNNFYFCPCIGRKEAILKAARQRPGSVRACQSPENIRNVQPGVYLSYQEVIHNHAQVINKVIHRLNSYNIVASIELESYPQFPQPLLILLSFKALRTKAVEAESSLPVDNFCKTFSSRLLRYIYN